MQQVNQEITNNTTTTTTMSSPHQENMTHQLSPALEPGSKRPPPDPQHEEPLSSETQNVEKGSCNSKSPEDETVLVNACRDPSRLRESSSITSATAAEAATLEDGSNMSSGRERLKRHRVEVAGRVWIPDMWGQEGLLKDWIDCTAFDASLANSSIMSARASLAEEGRRANATTYRLENSC